jgi:hypothetical protein
MIGHSHQNPLRPDPLRPLKENTAGRSGRGLDCPPASLVASEVLGRSGTQRDAAGFVPTQPATGETP